MIEVPPPEPHPEALQRLGDVIRARRRTQGVTRAGLAERAGLSLRFLAQLESGAGNISFLRLCRLAAALGLETSVLVSEAEAPTRRPIALLGMRGAGKSTVGARLADRLGAPFVELDELIETEAAMPLAQIFELQGEAFFRGLEKETLTRVLSTRHLAVLAAGGGIVTEPDTFATLLRDSFCVWLKASPEEHWNRVIAQGDRRPMQDRPEAMRELTRLWRARAALYGRAHRTVETKGRSVDEVVSEICEVAGVPSRPSVEK